VSRVHRFSLSIPIARCNRCRTNVEDEIRSSFASAAKRDTRELPRARFQLTELIMRVVYSTRWSYSRQFDIVLYFISSEYSPENTHGSSIDIKNQSRVRDAKHAQIYVIADHVRDYIIGGVSLRKLRGKKETRETNLVIRNVILDMRTHVRFESARSRFVRRLVSFGLAFDYLPRYPLMRISKWTGKSAEIWRNYWILRAMNAQFRKSSLMNARLGRCVSCCSSPHLQWTISIPYMSRERVIRALTRDDTVR